MENQKTDNQEKIHGITTNPMDIQQKSKERLLRIETGYNQHTSLFSQPHYKTANS
jgi:hypothetical protein